MRISLATPADAEAVSRLIAEAFHPLEVCRWLVPEPGPRPHVLAGTFRIFVDHALTHGTIEWTADHLGVAVWVPRQSVLPAPADYDERLSAVCAQWTDNFRTLDRVFDENHPHEPHVHLAFLAVRRPWQGHGIGSALLHHRHQHLDQYQVPAYLEASSPRSRDLYARHGYQASAPFRLPDGPPMWPMWREPQPLTDNGGGSA